MDIILHVTEARYLGDYQFDLTFNDGRRGVVNLSQSLHGEMFEPLQDRALFAQGRVDPELRVLAWPNGADLAPEYLYFLAFKDDSALHDQFVEWGYLPVTARR